MSSLDIYAISKELQGLVGYRVENIYRESTGRFFLFKLKGKGQYRNPFLLIEPGIRLHLTEVKHSVPERPTEKIMVLRNHLKGAEVIGIRQIDFDRLIEITLIGKQQYKVYIEIFGNRPNFVVVGSQNQVISALWFKKMRHRDLLPGKEFELPPSRGKSILDMTYEEISEIITNSEVENEEIVRTLAQKAGGGGRLIEEVLFRANINKNSKNKEILDKEIQQILQATKEIYKDLEKLRPSVIVDLDDKPHSFQPIDLKSTTKKVQYFDSYSQALDFFYMNTVPKTTIGQKQLEKKKEKLLKVLEAQELTVEKFIKKKKQYKELGDKVYLQLDTIDELLSTIVQARKKNINWLEIQRKLAQAKEQGLLSLKILEEINPEQGTIRLNLNSEMIKVDFRKSATEIANEYYERAKKAARKIKPANAAILETKRKLRDLSETISEEDSVERFILKRRKRKWFEKYHWTQTEKGFLIIGGKDISGNEEIVKRRMKKNDLFFHAELHGAPYTVLVLNSSENEATNHDINTAALLAAAFSSGWKAGYGAIDVYYVPAENVSFTAPSGEYIPKGGIMVHGNRTYIKGVEMALAIGVQVNEFNATVIYGSEKDVRLHSSITVIIKPGSIPKGKIAKQLHQIFNKKTISPEEKAKIRGIDLNEFVQAIPHNSVISRVEYGMLEEIDDSNHIISSSDD